jgi:hypothetical protein
METISAVESDCLAKRISSSLTVLDRNLKKLLRLFLTAVLASDNFWLKKRFTLRFLL